MKKYMWELTYPEFKAWAKHEELWDKIVYNNKHFLDDGNSIEECVERYSDDCVIVGLFNWSGTPEGNRFWNSLYVKYISEPVIIRVPANKLSRKFYPDYKEKDGYLYP